MMSSFLHGTGAQGGETRAHPKIAIVVDNPRRDLRGMVLLAHQFAKRGAECFLVPMYQQGYDLPLLAPDMVVLNYARESNRSLLECYRELGISVAVLDTEGGVLSESGFDSPSNWARSFRQSGLSSLVDYYCFWGHAVHDAFVRHSGMDAANLCVTGCPRYDLCNPPWDAMLTYPRRGFVLVNTNFSAINPAFTRSHEHEQQLFLQQGWEADYVRRLFAELQEVFPRYLAAIKSVATALPDRTVQIRPHPFENDTVYREYFAGVPNVVVDGAGDIFNALRGADSIVHLNCGSSIDAIRMGKAPISMEFLNTEVMRRHAPLPSRVSCHARDLADLAALISDEPLRSSRYDLAGARREIEPWYFLSDGRAAERVAEFLLAAVRGKQGTARKSLGAAFRGGRARPSPRQFLLGGASLAAGSHFASLAVDRMHEARQHKRLDQDFVADLVGRYRELGGGPALRVDRLRSPLAGQPLSTFRIRTA